MENIRILLKDGEKQIYDEVDRSFIQTNWFVVEKGNFQFIINRDEIKEIKTEHLNERKPQHE